MGWLLCLTACDPGSPLCGTEPLDVFSVQALSAGEGQFSLEPGEAVLRRFEAEVEVSHDVLLEARYTLMEPDGGVEIAWVDCTDRSVIAPLNSEPNTPNPLDITCEGRCDATFCIAVSSTADELVTVDDDAVVFFRRTLRCGQVGRTESEAPFSALRVQTLPALAESSDNR